MFQERDFVSRNWEPSPVPPGSIDYLLLTHAHLDHSGLIPRLVANGFDRTILTTAPSKDLAEIILNDSAYIQKEDAAYKAKRHKREKRKGPHSDEPLYTAKDAGRAMRLFKTVRYNEPTSLNGNVSVTFHDAGHILGSAMLELTVTGGDGPRTILFSGDIGECGKPIIRDPSVFQRRIILIFKAYY